jgi:phosphatidate cytidylyltransferase
MKKELKKRIITSILLFMLVLFCIFTNSPIYIITVLIVSLIAISELATLIWRMEKYPSTLKWIPFRLIAFFYIFFIFAPLTVSFYTLGPVFILYILLVCIFSDIGGYVVGKTIGGKKLTKISPNKTISGSLGSFCFSLVVPILYYIFGQAEYFYSIKYFLLCLQISLVCQLGDLFISYIKRKAKVKDTGKFLPGHGGLLDRIDGLIFAFPYIWFYLYGVSAWYEMLKATLSRL